MKNKNPLYIVFGIGAGIIAYYLFCKKKDDAVAVVDGQVDENIATKDAILGGGSGSGSVGGNVTPQNPTIVPIVTPLVLSSNPIVQGKPPIRIINPSPTSVKVVPRPAPRPISVVSRPILTTAPIGVRPITSIISRFDGFDGSSFEVGDCLNDL